MSLIYTILIFILTISIIVTFHEYGHYIAARMCGVKNFTIFRWFWKKIFGRKFGKDNTEYKICALPLGGYVKMLDEREERLITLKKVVPSIIKAYLKGLLLFSQDLYSILF